MPWEALVAWKLEEPQPPLAEPHLNCLHSYPVTPRDLVGIDGTTEVTFDIVRGEVYGAHVTRSSGNSNLDATAVECISGRRYVRHMVTVAGEKVDQYQSLTVRERISWADALKPDVEPGTSGARPDVPH